MARNRWHAEGAKGEFIRTLHKSVETLTKTHKEQSPPDLATVGRLILPRLKAQIKVVLSKLNKIHSFWRGPLDGNCGPPQRNTPLLTCISSGSESGVQMC